MTSSDWLTLAMWGLGAIGTAFLMLLAIVAYFLKRMVNKNDETGRMVHKLRDEMGALTNKFNLFKLEMRLVLNKMGIKVPSLKELKESEEPGDLAAE
jgi:methyl-accepting chemotaxis protein